MRFAVGFSMLVVLSGCVSTYMTQYIGRDIREVMMFEGQPVNTFRLDDGRMAYQFILGTVVGATPDSRVAETTRETSSGDTLRAETRISGKGSAVYTSRGCLVTYITRKRGDAWIVEDIRYPARLVC